MAYPAKITDLKPSELVSDPVVIIDYDLLPGLPAEAQEAILKAVSVFESFCDNPVPREQVVAYRRPLTDKEADRALKKAQDDWRRLARKYEIATAIGFDANDLFERRLLCEINGWAIKENRPPIASDQDLL